MGSLYAFFVNPSSPLPVHGICAFTEVRQGKVGHGNKAVALQWLGCSPINQHSGLKAQWNGVLSQDLQTVGCRF